jgi:hypothetical protein
LNSGVTFWRDTEVARRPGKAWHENWRTFFPESNDFADQPAFIYSLTALGISPAIMVDKYNARVGLSAEFAGEAIIYHFYASDRRIPGHEANESLLTRSRAGIVLDAAAIDAAVARSHDGRLIDESDIVRID